jgi:hypothetical protein
MGLFPVEVLFSSNNMKFNIITQIIELILTAKITQFL